MQHFLPTGQKYFNMMATCRTQSPNMPRADRVDAAHGGAAWRGRARHNRMPTVRMAQKPATGGEEGAAGKESRSGYGLL